MDDIFKISDQNIWLNEPKTGLIICKENKLCDF